MNLWVDFDLKFDPILQGKNGQNKPENQQNWNMAKIAPKSDKFIVTLFHCDSFLVQLLFHK